MSERFELKRMSNGDVLLQDNLKKESYSSNNVLYVVEYMCSVLNEQQATINELRKLNNAYAEKFGKIVNLISEDVVIDDE